MISVANRLKDAIWSIRRRFGLETDIDRVFPFIAFDRGLNRDQLEDLFIVYPKRTPEDFNSALIIRIQKIVRRYWEYRLNHKGYHRVLKDIFFLEKVVRYGYEGCRLIEDADVGFVLQLKPEYRKKK